MNSTVGSAAPSGDLASSTTTPEVSLFRLYTLRVASKGAQLALLAGLGATAALGLRYPVKMLPILLFEMVWKAIYLIAFALPLWSAHQINQATAEDIKSVLMVVILVPLIPWRYVFLHYVLKPGDRWK